MIFDLSSGFQLWMNECRFLGCLLKEYLLLLLFAFKNFVLLPDGTIPYGSWKDIKYFCDYVKTENGNNIHHPLIFYAVKLVNSQISKDYEKMLVNSNEISLTAKWVPREKSSFGWLYEQLATDHFVHIVSTATNSYSIQRAILKCKTEYRKVLSALNRKIDTLQIKQCGNNWSAIDFSRVTSISITKQKKAFLNVKNDGL